MIYSVVVTSESPSLILVIKYQPYELMLSLRMIIYGSLYGDK